MKFDRGPRSKLSPGLLFRGPADEAPGAERVVTIQIGPSADSSRAADALTEQGAHVTSAGPGVIVASVPQPALLRIAALPWVLSVQEQQRLHPKMARGK